MAYIPDYRDGTVSLTTGTKDLVGAGTAWTAIGLQPGDMFMVGGFVALIETVVDDTHVTLRDNWGGPTLPAGSSYSIKFSPDQSRVQASVVDLIRRLSSGNIDALSALTLEADRVVYADGPNSLALSTLTAYARGLLAAADAAAVLTALGATTIGQALLKAANPGAAQDALGATAVGKAVLTAADQAAGRTAIGSTAVGGAVFTAADPSAARAAIGAAGADDVDTALAKIVQAPCGRLSLASGVPITESDVAGATSIYYAPTVGNYVPIFDGFAMSSRRIGGQLVLPLSGNAAHIGYHQAARNFDLFVFDNGGVTALGSGPSWNAGAVPGSDVTRGTGSNSTELESFEGFLVNKNEVTIRFGSGAADTLVVPARRATYVGSFRATANGQASDTISKRLLFNAYNVASRKIFVGVPTNVQSYTYSAAAWQSLNNLGLKAELLFGLSGTLVSAKSVAQVANSSTSPPRVVKIGIGLDSAIPATDGVLWTVHAAGNLTVSPIAFYDGYPGLGYHYLQPVEHGAGNDTQTWYTAVDSIFGRTGMIGNLLA